jgi:hypothetical protein
MAGMLKPNHRVHIAALRRMTPEQRLLKTIELTERARMLFREGLRLRHPDMDNASLNRLYLERLQKCHNRNY